MRSLGLAVIAAVMCGLCGPAFAVPAAPVVTWPANGAVCGSNRPDISWSGDAHDEFEVHISSHNVPSSPDQWDSGPVLGAATQISSGPLDPDQPLDPSKAYYVFVRLRDATGWGPWSTAGRHFYTAGKIPEEPYFVGDPVGSQWPHSIAYNPDLDQYLVAFNDTKVPDNWMISYYLLDSAGKRISAEFTIQDSLVGTHEGTVTYDSVNKEYLIAYCGWQGTSNPTYYSELWVRRVAACDRPGGVHAGDQLGANIRIASQAIGGRIGEPRLAYSPEYNVYYLVWQSIAVGSTDEVLGVRLVGGTAAMVGSPLNLTAGLSAPSGSPRVLYNSTLHEFYVLIVANNYLVSPSTCYDLHGQRVKASDGTALGGPVALAVRPDCEDGASVCWDADLNRYLVAYHLLREGASIWGQFVRASDGAPIDPDGTPSPGSDPFMIADMASSGQAFWGPEVAWNPVTKEFMVGLCGQESNSDYGQRLSQNGELVAIPFRVTGALGDGAQGDRGNWLPFPHADPVTGEWLFCWYHWRSDVYTRRYIAHPLAVPDSTPPAAAAPLAAAPGDQQVTLTWTNPPDSDFAGILIRYAVGTYPTGPGDGQFLAYLPNLPGVADSFTHTGLNGGVTYCYSLFTYDEVPNYSPGAKISSTPAGPRVFSASSFTAGADGWSTAVWKAGAYDFGTMGWHGSAGSSGGGMRCTGAGASDNDFRETREGGEMWRTISTAHYEGIRVSYDLRVSSLGVAFSGQGSGGSGIVIDHDDIQEQLTIFYSTDSGATWTEIAPWLGRGTLATYLAYGTRQLDLSGLPGVDNNPGFALKFRWQLNQATDAADLDSVTISGSQMESVPPAITVASPTSASHCPANATPLAVSGVASDNAGVTQVTWSNNRGGSGWCTVNPPGERTVYWDADVALQPGQNMLTVTARDLAGNARSDTLMVVYSPDPPVTVGAAKKLADNALAHLSSKTVTAVFGDHFYIQEPDRTAGIRVKPYSMLGDVAVGKTVDAGGFLKTETNGEHYLYGSALVTGQAGSLSPVGMGNASLGGSSWFYDSGSGAGQRGIEGGFGVSNIGLLATIWGRVTQVDTSGLQYFYVDDGSGLTDGTQTADAANLGVRVKADPTSYPTGSWVSVTGISTCFKDAAGKLRRQIVPRPGGVRLLGSP